MFPENNDRIVVLVDGRQAGRLVMSPDHLAVFEYHHDWLQTGWSLSPFHLPLEPGLFTARRDPFDGMFGVFSDSLPDGWGNLLLDRWLRENGVRPDTLGWSDRLSLIGRSGMGTLCYRPEVKRGSPAEPLPIKRYAEQVEKILKQEPVENLDHLVEKAGSPGGARPKVLVELDGEPWLVKFQSSHDPEEIGRLEFDYSLAAAGAGLDVPESRLIEGRWFGVRRFDLVAGERGERARIHMHTASGLLYASHRHPSLDYTDLMKATLLLTRSYPDLLELFARMVFNVLTGNRDDHAKNFSFLCVDGEWRLSPAYDLVFSSGFNGFHSTTVEGRAVPSRDDLFRSGEKAGLLKKDAHSVFDRVYEATAGLRRQLRDRFGFEPPL